MPTVRGHDQDTGRSGYKLQAETRTHVRDVVGRADHRVEDVLHRRRGVRRPIWSVSTENGLGCVRDAGVLRTLHYADEQLVRWRREATFNSNVPALYKIKPLRDVHIPERGQVELLGDLREGRVCDVRPRRRHVHRRPEQLRYPHRLRALELNNEGLITLTPHDSRGDGTGRVSRFRCVGSVDDVLDMVVDVEGAISGRRKGTAVRASEGAACDEAFVDVIGVRQLGGPSLTSGTR